MEVLSFVLNVQVEEALVLSSSFVKMSAEEMIDAEEVD